MHPKLSICITTLNRAAVIGATLESVISQAKDDVEIVVLDAASTDNTEQVVAEYARRFGRLRYIRQQTNNGLDRDFDRAVELAEGEYCWLLSDDDILKDGAINSVLDALNTNPSLIIVNAEHRDFQMSKVLHPRLLEVDSDRTYPPDALDRLFEDTRSAVMVISCVIIMRVIWIARVKDQYYGSMFIHVGVIFQDHLPGNALVIAKPLVSHRRGNTHSAALGASFDIIMMRWPRVVSSLAIPKSLKMKVCDPAQFKNFRTLLTLRSVGWYSLTDYRQSIRPRLRRAQDRFAPLVVALLPGVLINTAFVLFYSMTSRERHASLLQTLRESRYHLLNLHRRV